MEFIQSKDNKTIKRIVSLGQRKNRSKCGEYIVEGIRSIRDISTMGVIKTIVIFRLDKFHANSHFFDEPIDYKRRPLGQLIL
jgi:hypothetical protein